LCFSTQNLHSFTHAFILVLVLQGNAATKLRCGGKFFILVMSYFLLIVTVKEFLKSTNICQSYSKNKSGPVFSDSQCTYPENLVKIGPVFPEIIGSIC